MLKGTCHCGAAHWTLEGDPGTVTACSCSLCSRYGVIWAYDYLNERIHLSGDLGSYIRPDKSDPSLEVLFCPTCANVVAWRGLHLKDGRRRVGVNIRLAPPEEVAGLKVVHLDGLGEFKLLPDDGATVRDLWF